MTLCHYSEVLKIAARLAGLEYAMDVGASGLSVDEERVLRVAINTHLQMLWPKAKWPGVTRIEQRLLRNATLFLLSATYLKGAEVLNLEDGNYYIALRNIAVAGTHLPGEVGYWGELAANYDSVEDYVSTTAYAVGDRAKDPTTGLAYQCAVAGTGVVVTDPVNWGLLNVFDAYVPYAQTSQTEIWEQGEIVVWSEDPRATTRAVVVPSWLSNNGVQVNLATCPVRPWIEFKIRVPNLFGEYFNVATTYAVADQITFETSSGNVANINFYNCASATTAGDTPTSAAAKWTRVELPDLFRNYLGAKAALNFLVGDSDPRFALAEAAAQEAETNLNDLLYRVQGQVPRTCVLSS